MSRLSQIQQTVQQVAAAIASVLGVEVTIVDEKLLRVAGTGCYQASIGCYLDANSVFAKVLRQGRGTVILEPIKDQACATCKERDICTERAQVSCPIILNHTAVGIIALTAFTDTQRQMFLRQQQNLFDFLNRMAELVASKIAEHDNLNRLRAAKYQLETVLNTVKEGIIAADQDGRIVRLNTAASLMLDKTSKAVVGTALSSLLPGLSDASDDLDCNREWVCVVGDHKLQCLATLKPWATNSNGGIVVTLRKLAEVHKIASQLSTETLYYTLEMILGDSVAINTAKAAAERAAVGNATVLIQGESGTGKELFARAIHYASDRRHKAFIAINCAAIPEALLESELFGYEDGAFTGARRGGKPGKFELADGGTIFLDEIGDMSLLLQAKLLRVLQERRVERLGAVRDIPTDIRIITATHKDLEAMVVTGEFRQDLYYRLNVFPLFIPPLRQRQQDLYLLSEAFRAQYATALDKQVTGFTAEALAVFRHYSWPGNVRELANTIEYMVTMAVEPMLSVDLIPARIRAKTETKTPGSDVIESLADGERKAILYAMSVFGDTFVGKQAAAQALGISKATLYRKLNEYGYLNSSQSEK